MIISDFLLLIPIKSNTLYPQSVLFLLQSREQKIQKTPRFSFYLKGAPKNQM